MMDATKAPASLADRLRDTVVSVRGDLDISRHVFRAGPAYVMRDPITFTIHRFDPGDYRIFCTLRDDSTLAEIFEGLVASGELERSDEEGFYSFILDLHQRNLLSLPVNDADALYRRFERRRRAEQLSKVLGIFFMRVPLINPDQFLSRTILLVRWLFTVPALFGWLALCGSALVVAISRWNELASPVITVLDGNNVGMLFAALIGLKVIHEFGHAYACKAFGGHVPEMGAFLVLFTPLAYVDATDSWTFSRMRRRAVVTLAGVYFESIIGAIAVFVWAATEASALHMLAYQVIVLSTVTTVVFNLNPLLRYDAYYLASDLVGVPNLRARCQEAVAGFAKRILYGVRPTVGGEAFRPSVWLALFGLAQVGYRSTVMITVATVLVMKFGGLGLVLAVVITGLTLGKALLKLTRYVISSEEVAPMRLRAIGVTSVVAGTVVFGATLIPAPWPIDARGVVSFEAVSTLRAPVRGTLGEMPVRVGELVRAGQSLAVLENLDLEAERSFFGAEHDAAESRTLRAGLSSPGAGMEAATDAVRVMSRVRQSDDDISALRMDAPADGRILEVVQRRLGVRVERGDPMLILGSGLPEAVVHVRAFEFAGLRLAVGDTVECRSPAYPERRIFGTVTFVGEVGTKVVEHRVQRSVPTGLVPLNAATGMAADPYFEIRLRLAAADAGLSGSQVVVRLPSERRTTAQVIERRVRRFLNRVSEGADG